jgi:hypothetical protein
LVGDNEASHAATQLGPDGFDIFLLRLSAGERLQFGDLARGLDAGANGPGPAFGFAGFAGG